MRLHNVLGATVLVLYASIVSAHAQDEAEPPDGIDTMPILRLEAEAPTSFVSALAFNPTSSTLYAGSWDKVVRVWAFSDQANRFILDPAGTYRVPVGPGMDGAINAVAVSDDGRWLAIAGRGVMRGASDQRHPGWVIPATGTISPQMLEDLGTIYLFDTRTREARLLSGHRGAVSTLAFAHGGDNDTPVLLSIGVEMDQTDPRYRASVRAWDVARTWDDQNQRYLGGVMLPPIRSKPGIAGWRIGPDAGAVRVAILPGDGTLRIWDVAANTLGRDIAGGQFQNTAAWWDDGGRLITGSTAALRLWSVNPAVNPAVNIPLRARDVPRDIVPFSSRGADAPADHAAVAVTSNGAVWLRVINLTTSQIVSNTDVRLWNWNGAVPSLAIAPKVRQLAVAGQPNHQIVTIGLDELLRGLPAPRPLSSKGITVGSASFARKGDAPGILIGRQEKQASNAAGATPAIDELVFDPALGTVSGELAGWQRAEARLDGWRVETGSNGEGAQRRLFVNVVEPDTPRRGFWLPEGTMDVTGYALRPQGMPILAVASRRHGGEPKLEIYDASAGASFARVRELSGHADAIHSLAFSDDGRLLLTAARDQTMCVWDLGDLDTVAGKRGTIADIEFQYDRNNRALVVEEIRSSGPNRGKLANGDVLLGWADGQETVSFDSPLDFYLRLSHVTPGEMTPPLRVRRAGGGAPQTVQLAVVQGTDERKPLFSMFVTEGDPAGWIGWSPMGPYESNGRAVEQMLGWHFNVGFSDPQRARAPTRFASIAEYKELYHPGLVAQLLHNRELPAAKPRPLDRPDMGIRVGHPRRDTVDYTNREETVRFGRDSKLELELVGLSADQVQSVELRLDNETQMPLRAVSAYVWSAGLAQLPKQREREMPGSLIVITDEPEPQTFSKPIGLLYQGEPPAIEIAEPATDPTVTEAATIQLKAHVWSLEDPNEPVTIRWTHKSRDKEQTRELPAGATDVSDVVQLEEGDNTITIEAANAAWPEEKSRLVRRVLRNPMTVAPPELRVKAISPDSGQERYLSSDQGEPFAVDSPELRLEGEITAQAPLVDARYGVDNMSNPCDDFEPNAGNQFSVRQQITLAEGEQSIRLMAKADGGLPTEASLKVIYAPPPAEALIVEPAADVRLVEGRDPPRVQIRFRLVPPSAIDHATILVNGKPSAAKPAPADDQSFLAEVPLEATETGENQIAVQVTNDRGSKRTSNEAVAWYLRPPQIVELKVPERVDSALLELTFEVQSPAGQELTELEVSGWQVPLDTAQFDPATKRWTVTATDVPLRMGVNEITPRARNAHGWSEITKTARVTVMLPPPPKPTITVEFPGDGQTMPSAELKDVRFTVRSRSPLRQVVVLHNSRPVGRIDVAKQVLRGGEYRLEASVAAIKLQPALNHLEVAAVNDGGKSQEKRMVSYVSQPVRIVVERLVSGGKSQRALQPTEGQIRFAEALAVGDDVTLYGKVIWPDAKAQRDSEVTDLHVWVNGLLQRPVPLLSKPGAGLQTAWEAKTRANKAIDNVIEIGIPGVPREATRSLAFHVDCDQPDESQRLHLLVVGVGDQDPGQLESLALHAVGSEPDRPGPDPSARRVRGISAPAFDKAWIYQLIGEVSHSAVVGRLSDIRERIVGTRESGADVVIVYYRGTEGLDKNEQYCLNTSDYPINSRDLSRFANVPGAQLFFLDVKREENASRPTVWPREPHTAAMRYVWPSQQGIPANASLLERFYDLATTNAARSLPTDLKAVDVNAAQRPSQVPGLKYESTVRPPLGDIVLVAP